MGTSTRTRLAQAEKRLPWEALTPAIPALLVGGTAGVLAGSWILAVTLSCGVGVIGVAVKAIGEKLHARQ
jgi:hypothetical protein